MILSTHVVTNGSVDFSENFYSHYSPLKMCIWNFCFGFFYFFILLSSFFCCWICFQNKKYCLKIMKKFWFKHRNCVFLELKICISYFDLQYLEFCVNFHFVKGGEGGGQIHVHITSLTKYNGTLNMFEFFYCTWNKGKYAFRIMIYNSN